MNTVCVKFKVYICRPGDPHATLGYNIWLVLLLPMCFRKVLSFVLGNAVGPSGLC